MRSGAITPEELESLLGFVLGDRRALAGLFEADAVLCVGFTGPDQAALEAVLREFQPA